MGMVEVEQIKNLQNVKGIIWTGYNGQAQGTAMARILFGDVNPGGKLNVTWYKSLSDLPDFNNYSLRGNSSEGFTYWYFNKDVSYEFGFGLSYTTFEFSNFTISKNDISPNDKIKVSVDVKNSGKVDGDEVVQIYVRTPDSPPSLDRPIKRLKGFKRVTIPAGQIKTVTIDIDCDDLWFWDATSKKISFDQGKYVFEIGASSKDIKGTVEARLKGEYIPVLTTVVAESNKLILSPGESVQTNVSACMSDDSFYDIDKAKVVYTSNNPSVATVDNYGKVTASGVGVALIFAKVMVDGIIVSNSYPIKVMPDLTPKNITVNGKNIKNFNKEIKAYSYLFNSKSKTPLVKATATGSDIFVDIIQANGIPGTAIVKIIDQITLETNTYYLNFDYLSVSDEFSTGIINTQWEWIREDPAGYSFTSKPGALTLTSEPGDISESTNNASNVLLQSANNDWTIETKLVGTRIPSQPENAGIVAYQDDHYFVKLMYRAVIKTYRGGGPGTQVQPGTIDLIMEENDITKSIASFNLKEEIVGNNNLYLKLEKKGSFYTGKYSLDGMEFKTLGTANILLKNIKAGLIVCDGIITQNMKSTFYFNSDTTKPDSSFDVSFDYFHITNYGLK